MRLMLILLSIGAAWGLTIPLAKIAVSTGHEPFGIVLWEALIATIVLGAYSLFKKGLFTLNSHRVLLCVVIALSGTVLPGAFYYTAASGLPAGVMALATALVPVWSLPIAIMIGLERFEQKRLLGVLMGAIAVLLIIGPENALPDKSQIVYVLIALAAPFFYAVEGNFISHQGTDGLNSIQVMLGASIAAAIFCLPVTAFTGQWVDLSNLGVAEAAIIALSCLHIGAYCAYIWLVGRSGAVFASQVAYLVTILGIGWSILLLGEGYTLWIWLSLIVLMLGLSLVLPRQSR